MKNGLVSRYAWAIVLGMSGAAAPALALNVGDKAPALAIAEWIQGEPIDFAKDIGKRIYMVEFWATWCPPCKISVPVLNKIQNRFKDQLTIIGVTSADDRGNTVSAVKRFVKEHGAGMIYHVAMDRDERTTTAYLASTGIPGIPYAYLVGNDGKIAWHGSPLDPAMEDIVTQLVAGKYDAESAKKAAETEREVQRRFQELFTYVQRGEFSKVWDGLIGILKLDPGNMDAMDVLTQIYVNETRDVDRFRRFVNEHIAAQKGSATVMLRLATVLCNIEDLGARVPDLAIEAAKAGYEASDRKDPMITATYAQALYQVGALDRAIELQKEAIAVGGEEAGRQATDTLAFYTKCKELQAATP